jgi:Nucleotidyltransferase of unknown function (DUF6036)
VKQPPTEIERFVRAIDANLAEPASILVIGGAAAVLGYGATRPTDDIDTFHVVQPEIRRAVEAARAATRLNIPVSFAAVAEAPYDFEDRLTPLTDLGLTRLTVVVPERHDLALMKMLRGYQHDIEVIEQIHQRQPLSLDVLRSRFGSEMSHVLADPRIVRLNFYLVVERLFGREQAVAVRAELERAQRGPSRGPER